MTERSEAIRAGLWNRLVHQSKADHYKGGFMKNTQARRAGREVGRRTCGARRRGLALMGVLVLGAGILLLPPMTAQAQQTPTYSVVYTFSGGTDGDSPQAGLVADASGNLYGTTPYGGAFDSGTVFKIDPSGNETILYNFTGGLDGANPYAAVILDAVGNLYGTTSFGGFGSGVVFRLDSNGNQAVLYTFTGGSDGSIPAGSLLRDGNGNLYGTTAGGGDYNFGVVFKLETVGNETVLHSFAGSPADGEAPLASLTRDAAGNLYGTTEFGGTAGGGGTVFELSPNGEELLLHSFSDSGKGGAFPVARLLRDGAGNLFGTTELGGGSGVAFELDSTGKETVLHNFTGKEDGGEPVAGLVRDSAGILYGTTVSGGDLSCGAGSGCGVVFRMTPAGKESIMYRFTGGTDGAAPYGALLPYKGYLYGTGATGGNSTGACSPQGCGVIFKLTLH